MIDQPAQQHYLSQLGVPWIGNTAPLGEQLKSRKAQLEKQLTSVIHALNLLEKNPEIGETIEAIQKAL